MSKRSISIVLPTYNVERYISRCLDSLLRQSFTDFEVLIIDDCGTDRSIRIAQEYARRHATIKIIANSRNMGTYHARRIGVEHAQGDYIVFLDPDDELEENTLDLIHNKFIVSNADILLYGITYVPKRKWYVRSIHAYPPLENQSLLEACFGDIKRNHVLGSPGKAYERNFLLQIYRSLAIDADFRYIFAEDVSLFIEAMLMKPRYIALKHAGYIYYSNPTSITMVGKEKSKLNIDQYDFMLTKLRDSASKRALSEREQELVHNALRKLSADKHLFFRNSGAGYGYLKSVFRSFCLLPTASKVVRMLVYVGSLGKLKV